MTTISYEDLSSKVDDVTVLDVRNRDEVQQHGRIPGSQCIPLPELESALDMDNDSFQLKYGFEKPAQDSSIVTYCMKGGGRGMNALKTLKEKGYEDVQCYSGSFTDWVKNGGEVARD